MLGASPAEPHVLLLKEGGADGADQPRGSSCSTLRYLLHMGTMLHVLGWGLYLPKLFVLAENFKVLRT